MNQAWTFRSLIIKTMAGKGVDTMLELRSQLQEKRATLMRQVEEERRRVARLEQESIQVNCKGILGTRSLGAPPGRGKKYLEAEPGIL